MKAYSITTALGGRWHGNYGLAFCPCHENTRTPALSVQDGDDGKLLAHCFAGCDGVDVLAALRARGLLAGRSDWKPDPREIERRKTEAMAERHFDPAGEKFRCVLRILRRSARNKWRPTPPQIRNMQRIVAELDEGESLIDWGDTGYG